MVRWFLVTDMIEKVARAMKQAMRETFGHYAPFDELDVMAKAAIEGLREPTDEMVRAGREAGFKSLLETAESDNDVPRDTWQAMLAAALGKDGK